MKHYRCGVVLPFGIMAGNANSPAQEKKPDKKADVFTNPAEAGPGFQVQGEYEGDIAGKGKYGAQVVALGGGKFDVYFLAGGLPGAGWDTKTRQKVPAVTENDKTTIRGGGWSREIAGGKLTGKTPADEAVTMTKVERKSKTLGEKPPEGAVILFDGTSADGWQRGKLVVCNLLFCGTSSKKGFATGKLHLEFRTPFQPKAGGQGRGNSGVYI